MIRKPVMRSGSINTMIQRAYGEKYQLHPAEPLITRPNYYLERIRPVLGGINDKRYKLLGILLLIVVTGASIYYYNLLVKTEQDVLAAKGRVAALEQRRNDISINLSKAVYDYSAHERSVFTSIVALRSLQADKGAPAGDGPPKDVAGPRAAGGIAAAKPTDPRAVSALGTAVPPVPVDQLRAPHASADLKAFMASLTNGGKTPPAQASLPALGQLLAVAEQYPQLKLSQNFDSLMAALVDVEKDLAMERIKYNESANTYSTTYITFPANVYAWIFRFEIQPYFEATDEAKQFKPIEY